ncbi:MAG: hypothetical protein FWG16_07500, partial [Micrococcales bacterium]|nr:hypothetical protein [Micrococcales bacterium]
FSEIDTNPEVCAVIKRLKVSYFYDDPMRYFNVDAFASMTKGLDLASGFELVDAGGSAAVYRITACQ